MTGSAVFSLYIQHVTSVTFKGFNRVSKLDLRGELEISSIK